MNFGPKKIVIDTNVLLSAAIYPHSPSARALLTAFGFCTIFHSKETLHELVTVLHRPKFDPYFVDVEFSREMFLDLYLEKSLESKITQTTNDCQDPKDNQFLSLALSVGADMIVTGDVKHLLSMHPYKGIAILSPRQFEEQILRRILLKEPPDSQG